MPVDVRLHGLVSTLAYFTGAVDDPVAPAANAKKDDDDDGNGSVRLTTGGNVRAGEMIAEAGREWAGRVLRKEDMEIYMFRLLLEWGRLTDDRRDEIGFVV